MNHPSITCVGHGIMRAMRVLACLAMMTTAAWAQDPPAPTTDAPPAVAPEQPAPPRAKTLDELLGIGGDGDGAEAAQADARSRLDRDLGEQKLADTFERAIEGMRRSTELLDRADSGADLARTQDEVLARLDAIIDEASRRQQQQQQSSSSSSSSSSSGKPKPGQQSQGGQPQDEGERQRRANARNNRQDAGSRDRQGASGSDQQGEGAPMEDAEDPGAFLAGEAEWGSLPPRVREHMRQGMRERMSSVYRTWTERYYERVAKESKP